MSAATWYVLPTACLPGCNSSIGKSQQHLHPQQPGICPYPSIDNISRSSSTSHFNAALLPGQLSHGDWAVPLPLGDSASSNITSGSSFAGAAAGFCLSESDAAYVGMFGVQYPGRAAAAAAAATSPQIAPAAQAAPRDTITDVLALLQGDGMEVTGSSDPFADDSEPSVRHTARAGVCPPKPVRPLPSVMLVPAAEVMRHMNCTAL